MIRKTLIALSLLAASLPGHAQQYSSLSRYDYSPGWTLHKGDTLLLRTPKDSLFTSVYAGIYPVKNSPVLAGKYGGTACVISGLEKYSPKTSPGKVFAEVKIDGKKYFVDIDRSVYEDEIALPQGVVKNQDYTPLTPQEVLSARINSIPLKDGKIFYDQVVEMPGMSKEAIFILLRNVFVEQFNDSKYVLEVNDPEAGRLTGKAAFRYSGSKQRVYTEGWVTYLVSFAVKDGKFRYQLYNFQAEGIRTQYAPFLLKEVGKQMEAYPFEVALQNYRSGDKKNYALARQYLADMLSSVMQFENSVKKAAKHSGEDISSF